ncbi:hypothetical protein R1X32_42815 [Rhodococcus opacus]|uniref:hypothetical protein n=1 Tax=Rhodococcus opacus TaxID=37919 RepID=UPI0034D36365
MTSPDNFVPGGPNTGWGDVGDFADQLGAQMKNPAGGILAQVFTRITTVLSGFLNVQAGLDKLVSDIVYGLKGVTGGLIDLTGIIASVETKANNAQDLAEQAHTEVTNVGESIVTVVDTINSVSANPFYISPNAFEDVSFPYNDLKPSAALVTSAVADHRHSYDGRGTGNAFENTGLNGGHSHTIDLAQPLVQIASSRLYLVPVKCVQDRVYSTGGLATNGATPAMTSFLAGIYTFDAATGNAERVWDFGNVKGDLVTGSTALVQQRFLTTQDIGALKGGNFYFGFISVGGTAPFVAAIPAPSFTRADTLHPKAMTVTLDGVSALPATVSGASVVASAYQLWGFLGQPDVAYDPGKQYAHSDSFNRADGTNYGPSWLTRGLSQGVRSGQAVPLAVLQYGQSGALYLNPTNTDRQRSSIVLGSYRDPSSLTKTRIFIRARSDFSTYACARFNSSVLEICSGSGFGNETVRASIANPVTMGAGQTYYIEASGNTFRFYYPGGSFAWTDSGGIVPTGTQTRYLGFGVDNTLVYGYSAAIDSWSGRDFL